MKKIVKPILLILLLLILVLKGVQFFQIARVVFSLQVPETTTNNLIVSAVFSNSVADKSGLVPGDVLVSLNGQTISNAELFQQTISEDKGRIITLAIQRGGQVLEKEILIPKSPPSPVSGLLGVEISNPKAQKTVAEENRNRFILVAFGELLGLILILVFVIGIILENKKLLKIMEIIFGVLLLQGIRATYLSPNITAITYSFCLLLIIILNYSQFNKSGTKHSS